MTVYIIQVFLILILSAGFHPASNIKGRKYFFTLSFLILTLVSGYRGYSVGADTKIYVRVFENIEYLPIINSRFEPGFVLYLKLLHFVSDDPSYMIFLSSFFCVGSALFLAYRFSKKPTVSILLYILLGPYFSQMNTMRQSIAMSIVIWAFIILLNDNKKLIIQDKIVSAILIVIAVSVHNIAVLAFIPWVLNLQLERRDEESKMTIQFAVFYTIFIAMIVYSAYSLIMRLAIRFFPSYAHYFSGIWSDSNYSASFFNTLMYLTFLMVGGIVLRGKKLTSIQRFSVIMLSLSIVFLVLSMRMEIWGRVTGMFSIYALVIWVPEFLNEIKLYSNRWIVETAVVLFSFAYMLIVLVFRPEWTMVVPYVFR